MKQKQKNQCLPQTPRLPEVEAAPPPRPATTTVTITRVEQLNLFCLTASEISQKYLAGHAYMQKREREPHTLPPNLTPSSFSQPTNTP